MDRCPTPQALDRAFVEPDEAIDWHVAGCPACRRVKAEHKRLLDAAGALPYAPLSADRVDQMKVQLAAAARATPQRRSKTWLVALAAAAVVAAAALLVARPQAPQTTPAAPATPPVARVEPPAAPAATVSSVEFRDGSSVFEVPALGVTTMFVRTDDAEIRTERARFQVVAVAGALKRLKVISGVLELRPAGGDLVVLQGGQTWSAPEAEAKSEAREPATPSRPGSGSESESGSGSEPESGSESESESESESGSESESESESGSESGSGSESESESEPPARTLDETFARGWRAFRDGDYGTAARDFAFVSASDSPFAEEAHYWRAVAELRRGHVEDAFDLLEAFLEEHPNSARTDEVRRLRDKLR